MYPFGIGGHRRRSGERQISQLCGAGERRSHLDEFGTGPDGRVFSGIHRGELASITYRRAWDKARYGTFTSAEYASPLARRVYDLRHACVSTWLNGGVPPA